MNFPTAFVLITLIVGIAIVVSARYRARAGIGQDEFRFPSEKEEALQKEVEQLRERVKVLERIATDDRHPRAIAEEIESLRDR